MFFKMLMATPLPDLEAYLKLSKAYYALLLAVAKDHTGCLAKLDPSLFTCVGVWQFRDCAWIGWRWGRHLDFNPLCCSYVIATLAQGIKSVTVAISTQCCATLDSIVTFVVTKYACVLVCLRACVLAHP